MLDISSGKMTETNESSQLYLKCCNFNMPEKKKNSHHFVGFVSLLQNNTVLIVQ